MGHCDDNEIISGWQNTRWDRFAAVIAAILFRATIIDAQQCDLTAETGPSDDFAISLPYMENLRPLPRGLTLR